MSTINFKTAKKLSKVASTSALGFMDIVKWRLNSEIICHGWIKGCCEVDGKIVYSVVLTEVSDKSFKVHNESKIGKTLLDSFKKVNYPNGVHVLESEIRKDFIQF